MYVAVIGQGGGGQSGRSQMIPHSRLNSKQKLQSIAWVSGDAVQLRLLYVTAHTDGEDSEGEITGFLFQSL